MKFEIILKSELQNEISHSIPIYIKRYQSILKHISPPKIQVNSTISSDSKITAWAPNRLLIFDDQFTLYNTTKKIQLDTDEILSIIPQILSELKSDINTSKLPKFLQPFIGAYGYIGFEFSRILFDYKHRDDHPYIPSLALFIPTKYLIEQSERLIYIDLELPTLDDFIISQDLPLPTRELYNSTDIPNYLDRIKEILNHIRNGEIYQANYTQEFQIKNTFTDKIALFNKFTSTKDVKYSAYIDYKSFQIISLSPELFLKFEQGEVLTKPIKGTRPRGDTKEKDDKLKRELKESTKDIAELSMIVDLLRNDLGKSAIPGSVEVKDHLKVESYENVHHLVSVIKANIRKKPEDTWKLFLRAFPGGSISGVPKIRALEIIENVEEKPRNVYTGSIGFIGINGDGEFNIAIRTILLNSNIAIFNSGGGIVYDSSPFEEYLESLHKVKHIASKLGQSIDRSLKRQIIWKNQKFLLKQSVNIPNSFFGFEGCFETIRIQDEAIVNLNSHMDRLQKGKDELGFNIKLPEKSDLKLLIKLNLVKNGKLNIFLYYYNNKEVCMMLIKTYSPPNDNPTLLLDEETFTPTTTGIKTLDYQPYRERTEKATKRGYWDTILVDNFNRLIECGRATIYLYRDGWKTPAHDVVLGTIRQKLLEQGVVISSVLTIEDLREAKAIAISNALVGIISVSKVKNILNQIVWEQSAECIDLVQKLKDKVQSLEREFIN